ncbi:MAG: hypothetical protein PVSMB5_20490 [Ktedonobacteraceae bacterium]
MHMYNKNLCLFAFGIVLATVLTLACTPFMQRIAHAAPLSMAVHEHRQVIIPGSGVVPLDGMDVQAMAAVSSQNIWIAGQYTSPSNQLQGFYEHFAGGQWHVIDAHIPGNSSNIASLSVVSARDIWAVGSYAGGALIEHWDGHRWTLADTSVSKDSDLSSVLALSATNVWAVGESFLSDSFSSKTLIKHFDGSVWRVVHSPSLGTKCGLTSITAVSPTELWAVGGSYYDGTITEHYIGSQWSLVPSQNVSSSQSYTAPFLISASALSAHDVWAVGDAHGGQPGPLIEHWDGQHWSLSSIPRLNGNYQNLTSVTGLQTNDVWARGAYLDSANNSRPLVTRWNGSVWSIVSLPGNLTSLSAWQRLCHSNTIIAIGTYDQQIRLLTLPML